MNVAVQFTLGSSNGRTAAFGAVSGGSNPPSRTNREKVKRNVGIELTEI